MSEDGVVKHIINNKLTIFSKFAAVLCVFVTLTLSAASDKITRNLAFNELELKDGKVLTFTSLSKIGNKALRVILSNGKAITISRDTLSNREEARRFKAPQFKYIYGTAKAVKSKLPKDFDTQKFMKDFKISSKDMKEDVLVSPFYAMKYRYFTPAPENIKKGEKVPLVVFLHGMGLPTSIRLQALVFIQPHIQKRYPSYYLAPMLNEVSPWCGSSDRNKNGCTDEMQLVINIIDEMIEKYPNLDEDRIYITGLSSGGLGAWEAISKFPGKFAGAVPLAAGWEYGLKDMKHKQKVAIWAFYNHKESDDTRHDCDRMIKRIAKLGGVARRTSFTPKAQDYRNPLVDNMTPKPPKNKKKKPKKKTLKVKNHFPWVWAYAEPNLIPWLFSHKRQMNAKKL